MILAKYVCAHQFHLVWNDALKTVLLRRCLPFLQGERGQPGMTVLQKVSYQDCSRSKPQDRAIINKMFVLMLRPPCKKEMSIV